MCVKFLTPIFFCVQFLFISLFINCTISSNDNPSENTTIDLYSSDLTTLEPAIDSLRGKDIYIVFNNTDSTNVYHALEEKSTEYLDMSYENQDTLKAANPVQDVAEQSAAKSVKKHGGLGGHGGHHNKVKIKVKKTKKKHKKHAGHGIMKMMMHPIMLLPQLIMLGFSPILLANLKMMVMNALMVNNMALSTAVFMTLRNMVFGPAPGPKVKYHNHGYKKPIHEVHYIPPEHHHVAHPPEYHHISHSPEHHHVFHPPEHHHYEKSPIKEFQPHNIENAHSSIQQHTAEPPVQSIHALTHESYNRPYEITNEKNVSPSQTSSYYPQETYYHPRDDNSHKNIENQASINSYQSSYFPTGSSGNNEYNPEQTYYSKNDRTFTQFDSKNGQNDRLSQSTSNNDLDQSSNSFGIHKSMNTHASYRLSEK